MKKVYIYRYIGEFFTVKPVFASGIKSCCFLCIFICAEVTSYAGGGLYLFPTGAKAEGMGKSGLLNTDIWSAYNNQAALAGINKAGAGIHYENRFAIREFGTSAGVFVLPALTGTFGFDVAHIGIEDYGETRIGAGYGKKLADRLSLGVQFNYHLLSFATGYPDFYTFTGEIGLIAEPLNNVFIGAHVFNPTFAKFNSQYEDPVQVIFELAAGYKTDKLVVVTEFEKEKSDNVITRFGIEYSMFKNMSFRSGVSLQPVEICFGIGWNVKKLQLDFAFSHHELLGYSPQLSLSFSFGK
ncbi:MAG: hypothetical protein LBR10_12490 [Prevotellaceae bacterium]|jgi:hypothetical protein|nr:hypothetical protein [Prevotellaceae bacterium]